MKKLFRVAMVTAIACSFVQAQQTPKLRLSEVEDTQPLDYKADLKLDPAMATFSGSIDLHVRVNTPVKTLWLNQENLKLQSAEAKASAKTLEAKIGSSVDDFVALQFDSALPKGDATIHIVYTGQVTAKATAGLFHQQDNGNWYLYSQFEPTDARAAFPCFDEPKYKTAWQLTLHVPASSTAIGNTQPESDQIAGDERTVVFKPTPPLPSYLVALAVGPFEYVPAGFTAAKHVPVRIVVPKGHVAEAKYAAEVTAGIINHHEKYFGMPFPYDKADQVAVPSTFGFGAMENPGMVTYAQDWLLAKPAEDSLRRQQEYFTAAAHELAHQWFGDLVTTSWWNDVWLNESFATWFEQKTTADMHPEWKSDVEDLNSRLGIMGQDSLVSARKIRQPIESRDDIGNAFDGITYDKGAAVIAMFEDWMTPEQFQAGVRRYMNRYKWQATTADQFLQTLNESWKHDVATPFQTFLNQSGVPLITVDFTCSENSATVQLSQQRYLPKGSPGSVDRLWQIPVFIRDPSGVHRRLLTEKSATLKLNSCPAWVDADANANGYYVAQYSSATANKLSDARSQLSTLERVDLIGEARMTAAGGRMPAQDALQLAVKFHDDSEPDVVEHALGVALWPNRHLVTPEYRSKYRNFLRANFDAKARELGWEPKPGEDASVDRLRHALVPALATVGGDEQLAQTARKLADRWLADHTSVNPNSVGIVLDTAAYYGDTQFYSQLLNGLGKTTDQGEKRHFIEAMRAFRDPAALQEGMDAVIDGKVPFIEGQTLLFAGGGQQETSKLAFEFVQANYDRILAASPRTGVTDFGADLPRVGASFCDAESLKQYQDFFQPRIGSLIGAPREYHHVLEQINLCIANTAENRKQVEAFLSAQGRAASGQ